MIIRSLQDHKNKFSLTIPKKEVIDKFGWKDKDKLTFEINEKDKTLKIRKI